MHKTLPNRVIHLVPFTRNVERSLVLEPSVCVAETLKRMRQAIISVTRPNGRLIRFEVVPDR